MATLQEKPQKVICSAYIGFTEEEDSWTFFDKAGVDIA